jgi:hypothetical protein
MSDEADKACQRRAEACAGMERTAATAANPGAMSGDFASRFAANARRRTQKDRAEEKAKGQLPDTDTGEYGAKDEHASHIIRQWAR